MSSRFCFWLSVSILGTHLAETFLIFKDCFNMDWIFPYEMPVSWIKYRMVTLRSLNTIFSTFATFCWVTHVDGRPQQSSSSLLVLLTRNWEAHLARVEYGGKDSPNVASKSQWISWVVNFFKQRYSITARISFFSIFENTFRHDANKWLDSEKIKRESKIFFFINITNMYLNYACEYFFFLTKEYVVFTTFLSLLV